MADKSSPTGYVVNRMGIVQVLRSDLGMSANARIWSAGGDLKETETEHREISHYLDSIFIGYRLDGSRDTGICFHKFTRQKYGELPQGVYMDRRSERRNTIIGVRDESFSNIEGRPLTEKEVKETIMK